MVVLRVVLTGGPCGGKTGALAYIKKILEERQFKVYTIPEIPTLLMSNGTEFPGHGHPSLLEYEVHLLKLVLQTHSTFCGIAGINKHVDSVLLFDRGALDVSVYTGPKLWGETLSAINETDVSLMARYDIIMHLETAAKGAEAHYTLENNAVRSETPEEARIADNGIIKAWSRHPSKIIVKNEDVDSFQQKLEKAATLLVQKIEGKIKEKITSVALG